MPRVGTTEVVPCHFYTQDFVVRIRARLNLTLFGFSPFPYNRECGGVAQVARATVS
jgi:hypothetical protein